MFKSQLNSKLPVILWGITATLILFAIISGLSITGGPEGQRMQKMDSRRLADLNVLRSQVQRYVSDQKELPEDMGQLIHRLKQPDFKALPKDPLTEKPYLYKKKSKTQFELCAVFQLKNPPQGQNESNAYGRDAYNQFHGQGLSCYQYRTEKSRFGHFTVIRE